MIAGREIGPGRPCFVIAEAGVNHNGRIDLARRLVDAAADAGADAVKFQTFRADRLVTPTAPKAEYQQRTTDRHESQFDMLRRLELSPGDHETLLAYCATRGILFLSTPFDEDSADALVALDVAALKIPSGELTNLPFLSHVARSGKPLIVSTGMATLAEVDTAVAALRSAGAARIVLMHCVSNYPAHAADVNLRAMRTLEETFGTPVGYSDHTEGLEVALAAVALGARVIEKHITLDRTLQGPDHRASIEPQELAALVRGVRIVESALGDGRKEPAASEAAIAAVARKSLVAACDIPAGATLSEPMIAIRRPGTGLPPAARETVVGRRTRVAIPSGTVISPAMLA